MVVEEYNQIKNQQILLRILWSTSIDVENLFNMRITGFNCQKEAVGKNSVNTFNMRSTVF